MVQKCQVYKIQSPFVVLQEKPSQVAVTVKETKRTEGSKCLSDGSCEGELKSNSVS